MPKYNLFGSLIILLVLITTIFAQDAETTNFDDFDWSTFDLSSFDLGSLSLPTDTTTTTNSSDLTTITPLSTDFTFDNLNGNQIASGSGSQTVNGNTTQYSYLYTTEATNGDTFNVPVDNFTTTTPTNVATTDFTYDFGNLTNQLNNGFTNLGTTEYNFTQTTTTFPEIQDTYVAPIPDNITTITTTELPAAVPDTTYSFQQTTTTTNTTTPLITTTQLPITTTAATTTTLPAVTSSATSYPVASTYSPYTSNFYFNPFFVSTIPNSAYYSTGFYGGSYFSYATGYPTSSSSFKPSCSSGRPWAGTVCLGSNQKTNCAPGYSLVNGQCYYQSTGSSIFSCKSGVWNGITCASGTNRAACGAGKYWNGQICLSLPSTSYMPSCSRGNYFHTGSASCLQYPMGAAACGNNQFWNGITCIQINSAGKCQSGYAWSGSVCVAVGTKRCRAGTYWNGVGCLVVPNTNSYYRRLCSGNGYWDGSSCKNPSNNGAISCSKGHYWHSASRYCLYQY